MTRSDESERRSPSPSSASSPGAHPWLRASDVVGVAAALHAAVTSGLLRCLGDGPAPIAELASATGTDPRGAALALDVLVDAGVVVRCDDRFALGPVAVTDLHEPFSAVEHLVRTGQPIRTVDRPEVAGRDYPAVVRRIGSLSDDLAAAVAAGEIVSAVRGAHRVLDVATGAAPFAIAFAREGAQVTATDLPGVLPTADAAIAEAGVGDRVDLVGGDLHELELEERYDVVVLAGYCRLVAPSRAANAIARCAGWLAPGGHLLVVDAVDTLEARRRGLARYALGLATRTATGGTHSFASYGGWLAAAGLVDVDLVTTERPELSLISARLPGGAIT